MVDINARGLREAVTELADEWGTGCGAFGIQLICSERLRAVLAAHPAPLYDPRSTFLAVECAENEHDCPGSFEYGACSDKDETIACACPCHTTVTDDHEHTFVEEQEPTGRLILGPCLTCNLSALDALEQLRDERDRAQATS